jgi:hypothetical protein
MHKRQLYRDHLRALSDWEAYLLAESGLPGPRGNLELAQAAADEGDETRFRALIASPRGREPAGEFLTFCGVVGLGKLVAEGQFHLVNDIRPFASDMRWRVREAVCLGLQRWGDNDMASLIEVMREWSQGNLFEQRAAVATLCEPRLLKVPAQVEQVLAILDKVTAAIKAAADRRGEDFKALRKGLGYCWSVAIAALPAAGKRHFEAWLDDPDHDVRWVMRENLKKDRLVRMDAVWVEAALGRV